MARDFESFIVDPNLLDPDIDATDLATTTDTRKELLSSVPDYAGIQYDPTQKDYLGDLYALYSGQLPSRPATPSAPPPATGGGGSGGEGQVTTPPTGGNGGGGVNTPEQQRLIDEGIGLQISPGSPVFAPGEIPVTQKEIDDFNKIPVNTDYRNQQLVNQGIGIRVGDDGPVFAPGEAPVTQADIDSFNNEQQSTLQNILGKAGQTVEGALTELGKIPGAIVDFTNKTVDVFGNKLDVGKTLAGAVLNKIAGGPVSLLLSALPEPDPRQRKLNEFYSTGEGAKYMDPSSPDYIPGMENYNTVSGGLLNTITGGAAGTPTNYGLQGAYQKRMDTVENTLQDKYGLTDKDIADIKAGTFDPEKMNVQTDLVQRLVDLGDAKKAEADMLGLTAAEEKRLQELDFKDYFAGNKDQDSVDKDQDSVDRFDTTAPSDLDFENQYEDEDRFTGDTTDTTVTGVTQPGTGTDVDLDQTVADDNINITGGFPTYDRLPEGASKTGTPIDALNPVNRQQHFDNTEKLKDEVRSGKLTNEEYNILSAFDARKTMGLGAVTGTGASALYQGTQTAAGIGRELFGLDPAYAGDQSVKEAIDDTIRNIQGVSGNVSPELQVRYQEIISGKDIYRDPILGMVEEDEKTLADEDITKIDDYITNEDLFGDFKEKEDLYRDPIMDMIQDGDIDDRPRSGDDPIGPGGRMDILDIGGEDDPDNEGMTREEMDAEAAQKAAEARAKSQREAQQKIEAAERQERERVAAAEKAAAEKAKREREMQQKIRDAENQERERQAAAQRAAEAKAKAQREAQQKIRDAENQERERQAAAQRAAEAKAKAQREAQQRIRDAENREAERQAAERQRAAEKAAKDRRDAQQQIRDAERDQAAKDKATREKDLGSGPPGIGGGGGNGDGGGCFLAGTLVTMADGSTKPVEQVDLKDNVAEGGKVFATGKFLVENLHDYKGIKVSGSHMVNEDGNWVRVEDSKHGEPLGDDEHTVYVFGSENRRILINGILFTDYFETTEQEKLINNEKDFFSNWKTYENKIDQDNINILNAS